MNVFSILHKIEKLASIGLGKGYGATSIAKETILLKKFLTAPLLAIDVGGNVGAYTASLKSNFKAIEVHIFEPSVTNMIKLQTRFADRPDIYLNKQALSRSAGSADLFSNEPGSGLASLTKRKLDHFNIDFCIQERIELMRLEDYWKSTLSMRKIDLVKIDVEGHELDVLNGFGDALQQTHIIQFEFGGCNIDTRTYFQDFWYFFKKHSFKIYRITPFGLEPIYFYKEKDETFSTTNYLCVNQIFEKRT